MKKSQKKKTSPLRQSEVPFWKKPKLMAWILIGLAVLLYINTLQNGFALDDEIIFTKNSLVDQGLSAWKDMLTNYSFQQGGVSFSYRPVLILSFGLQKSLFGYDPFAAHMVSLMLYALGCFLLYKVFLWLFPEEAKWPAFFSALLFLIHPIHSEVVNNIKSRDELMVLVFGCSTILVAVRMLEGKKMWLLPVLLLLGFLTTYSKDNGAIFIAFIPFIFIFKGQGKSTYFYWLTLIAGLCLVSKLPVFSLKLRLLIYLLYLVGMHATAILWQWRISGKINVQSVIGNDSKAFSSLNELSSWVLTGFLTTILFWSSLWNFWLLGLFVIFFSIPFWFNTIKKGEGDSPFLLIPALFVISVGIASDQFLMTLCGASLCFVSMKENKGSVLLHSIPIALGMFSFEFEYILLTPFFLVFKTGAIFLPKKKNFFLGIAAFFVIVQFIFNVKSNYPQTLLFGVPFLLSFMDQRSVKTVVRYSMVVVASIASVYQIQSTIDYSLSSPIQQLAVWNRPADKEKPKNQTDAILPHSNLPKSEQVADQDAAVQSPKSAYSRTILFAENPLEYLPTKSDQLGLSAATIGFYLQKLVIPHTLVFYYGYDTIPLRKLTHPVNLLILFLCVSGLIVGVLYVLKGKLWALGILFIFWHLAPFANIAFPAPGIVAERFAFLPSIGFCLFIASIIWENRHRLEKIKLNWQIWLPIFLVAGSSVYAWNRNSQWENMYTLVSHDMEKVPNSAKVNYMYGMNNVSKGLEDPNYMDASLVQLGIKHLRKCIEIDPEFPFAGFDLGEAYLVSGNLDSALLYFKHSVSVDSYYIEAPFYVGSLYQEMGVSDSSERYYLETIRRDSSYPYSYTNLSQLYFTVGEIENSLRVNRLALKMLENKFAPFMNIGKTYYEIAKLDSSYFYFSQALKLSPENPEAQYFVEQTLSKLQIDTPRVIR